MPKRSPVQESANRDHKREDQVAWWVHGPVEPARLIAPQGRNHGEQLSRSYYQHVSLG